MIGVSSSHPSYFFDYDISYPSIGIWTARLNKDHSLRELDAAYSNPCNCSIPYTQDSGLDSHHRLPSRCVIGIIDTSTKNKLEK